LKSSKGEGRGGGSGWLATPSLERKEKLKTILTIMEEIKANTLDMNLMVIFTL